MPNNLSRRASDHSGTSLAFLNTTVPRYSVIALVTLWELEEQKLLSSDAPADSDDLSPLTY